MALSAGPANAAQTVNPRMFSQSKVQPKLIVGKIAKSKYEVRPLKAAPAKAEGVVEAVVVDEDFSRFTSGTVEKPDTTQMLACKYNGYSPNGVYIDNSLTKDGTWFGNFVYSAGGAVALKTYNPQDMAWLCTPLGDYSGDVTVTFKAKALPALVATDDGYSKLTGSTIGLEVCYGDWENQNSANTDLEDNYFDTRLYEKDGWQKITVKLKNYSANNDGFLCFFSEGAVVIDDVQVSIGSSFLAQPVINGITDFQKDNFTISWQPTRKAYNYYVDLYKREYLSENDTTFQANFNDSALPEGFQAEGTTFAAEGTDASTALIMKNNESLTMPTNGNDYKTAHFSMKVIDPSVDQSDPYAKYYVQGSLLIDLKNADGWKNIGEYYAMGFWNDADVIKMEEEYSKFATGGFTQMRISASGLNKGAYIVIDDVDITAKPGFEYKIVGADYSDDLNNNYAFTASTSKTSYTFKDLDPNTDYYYGVRAHFVSQFSSRQFIHALGVAAPESAEATDIDNRGSFTATWQAVPKATGYTATCYGLTVTDKAVEDYPILEEDFSLIDANVTDATTAANATQLNNKTISYLDAYTKTPGWTGNYNTVAQGMLGAEGDYDYIGGKIYTPTLYLANEGNCKFTIKAHGEKGDNLGIRVDGTTYYVAFDNNGELDGYFYLPVKADYQKIRFSSYNYAPFALDYVKIGQDLCQGANALTWLAEAETDAATTSYTFGNLADYNFQQYGFNVVSHMQYDENTETSSLTPSPLICVDLVNGTSTGIEETATGNDQSIVARYSIDGRKLSAPTRGLNIVRLSNGKTIKVMVK